MKSRLTDRQTAEPLDSKSEMSAEHQRKCGGYDRGSDCSAPWAPGVTVAAVQRWPMLKCSSVSVCHSASAHVVRLCGGGCLKASRQPAEPDRGTQTPSRQGSSGVAEVSASAQRLRPRWAAMVAQAPPSFFSFFSFFLFSYMRFWSFSTAFLNWWVLTQKWVAKLVW